MAGTKPIPWCYRVQQSRQLSLKAARDASAVENGITLPVILPADQDILTLLHGGLC